MKDREIRIDWILFWIIIILLTIALTWRIFGSTPSIEIAGLLLTALGLFLGWQSRAGNRTILSKLEKLEKLENIEQVLHDIKNILEKK